MSIDPDKVREVTKQSSVSLGEIPDGRYNCILSSEKIAITVSGIGFIIKLNKPMFGMYVLGTCEIKDGNIRLNIIQ